MLARLLLALGIVMLGLAGCSEPGPPTAGQPATFATVCDEANDGRRVAVEGYLRLPESFTGERSVLLHLFETDTFAGPHIGVQTPIGGEANQMAMVPTSYGDDDLEVHLAGGQTADFGMKVKVSGKVYFPLVEQSFACALENPLFESAE